MERFPQRGKCSASRGVPNPSFAEREAPLRRASATRGRGGWPGCRTCFNPHLLRRGGATFGPGRRRWPSLGFNPHPLREAGATRPMRDGGLRSTPRFYPHPLREAGATPVARRMMPVTVGVFQSSPTPRSGCYFFIQSRAYTTSMFQSSPTPRSGCYTGSLMAFIRVMQGFNPHPLREAGAT